MTDRSGHDTSDRDGFRQYRAPSGNGESLMEPKLDQVPELLQTNIECLQSHGEPFASLRKAARRQLVEAAIQYTSAYRNVDWVTDRKDASIIMAGHQPAIFHPGVWFKNFALSHIGQRTGAIAINLIVDNDVAASSSIRVPTLDRPTGVGSYRVVAYDKAGGGVPYEQTTIQDRQQFDHFDQAVAEAIRPLVSDPCVNELWKHGREAIDRCGVAGCALAQSRHALEGELGLRTLELPLGVICRTPAFAEFTLSLLDQLPRFQHCYNDAARQYRKAHRIRSSAHPVPDLAQDHFGQDRFDQDDRWFEAPLWIYGDDSPVRRPAWVRRVDEGMIISDRGGRELTIDSRFPKLAAEQLASHGSPNFKLRPRALLTTMYARLVLSDLFLHGIGGGKYDQLGDRIIQKFFGIEPPKFMVISATVRLPGFTESEKLGRSEQERSRLKRSIRDTLYQGERFADQANLNRLDVEQKNRLLVEIPPKGSRREWQRELDEVNGRLANELSKIRADFRFQLAKANQKQVTNALMSSREHPFCLFPIDYLTETYRSLLSN